MPKLPEDAMRKAKAHAAGPRKRLSELPDDDPFVLIETLDATGGMAGTRKRMSNEQMAALRAYCLLPPNLRSMKHLQRTLEQEWQPTPRVNEFGVVVREAKAAVPAVRTLEGWAKKYDWDSLVREYDLNLSRWRLWQREKLWREADERQARIAQWMQKIGAQQIEKVVEEYNKPATPIQNPATGKWMLPRRSLAGIQGLAFMVKVGLEGERVALGMPTQIAKQEVSGTIEHDVAVSLDEWRRQTAQERLGAPTVVDSIPQAGVPRLPAPDHTLEHLDEAERAELPDDWFQD